MGVTNPDRGRSRRPPSTVVLWLGHHYYPFGWVCFGWTLLGVAPGVPWNAVMGVMFPLPVMMSWVVWLAARRHDRALCVYCLRAAPLLDPQGAVTRRRRELRLWHVGEDRVRRWHGLGILTWAPIAVYLAVPTMWLVVSTFARRVHGAVFVALAAGFGVMIYAGYMTRTHDRLQPWCPFCRRGHGDDPAPVVPDPVAPGRRNQ